ncbi:thiol reductant ABC exporter subunit CydC [Rhodobacterales bacterium]|nr:thiol reductant ABC exporter subunit CydC [Rhodobacterales bacterium]
MKAILQTILSQHRHDPLYFWLGILVAIVPAAAGILLLGVSGWFITAAAIAGLAGTFLNIFAPSAIIRGLAIGRTAGRYGERVLTHEATFRFLTKLRNNLFGAFANGNAVRSRTGLVLNRFTRDIAALDTIYLRLAVPLVLVTVVSLCLLVVWGLVSAAVLSVGAIFLGLWLAIALTAVRNADRKNARRADAAADAMVLRAADLAAGRRDLAIYGGLEQAASAVTGAGERLNSAEDGLQQRSLRLVSLSSLTGQIFLAAMLVVCALVALSGDMSVSLAVGLVLVAIAVPELMAQILPGLSNLPRTALSARRTRSILDKDVSARSDVSSHRVEEALAANAPVLRFADVSFRYPGAERKVIDHLSFKMTAGEVLAIAGRSGCGKSTVAALAARLRLPDAGKVTLNGMDLSAMPEADLRQSVTVISQRPYLFNDTVAANLRIANPAAGEEQLWTALEQARLAQRLASSPDGLQTVLGEGGLGLSGGEQRRLALARAFLTQPDVFILDEMTEGLDAETAADVLARFMDFRGASAVLMIAHKQLELQSADRVFQLPGGATAQKTP